MPRARSGPSPSQTYEGRKTPNRPTSAHVRPLRAPAGSSARVLGVALLEEGARRPRPCPRWRRCGPRPRARPPGRRPMSRRGRGRSGASPRARRAGRARRSPSPSSSARRDAPRRPARPRLTRPIRSASARVEDAAGQDQLLGPRRPDDPRQPLRPAAARGDRQAHLGQAEPGALRGDPEVAAQRQLEAAAERVALDRGDGRHRQLGQLARRRLLELVPLAAGRARAGPRTRRRASRRENARSPRPLTTTARTSSAAPRRASRARASSSSERARA